MEVSCVRNSWLTRPRSPARCPSSSSSGVRSCKVTTTDSTSPASERMGLFPPGPAFPLSFDVLITRVVFVQFSTS